MRPTVVSSRLLFVLALIAGFAGACGDNQTTVDVDASHDTPPASSAKELTSFSFTDAANPALSADVAATINGDQIAATVPSGTSVTALVATFATTGDHVLVGSTTQTSGTTANDFTSPVTYHVVAANGSIHDYTVTVTVAQSTAKELTAFSFTDAANSALSADVTATINGTSIAATVPFGTDVTALVATFTTTGASVSVGATAQVSGTTPNDFTSPVVYHVTAADSSTQDYTVTVTVAPNSAKAITAFSFRATDNSGVLAADVTATITGTNIAATVPFGTNVTALVATFTTTGASIAVASTAQVSGTTPNNFTTPVTYRVTAADTTTQDYTVTVTIAPSPAKAITAFSFRMTANPGVLSADVTATITGFDIAATVPFGTNVSALVATFTTTGASVSVGATAQASGITPNNFTNPVTYRVTAADSSTQDYTVTITIAPNNAKAITAFSFLATTNPGNLTADVTATITGTNITATVPFGTNVTALVATFATTGASVAIGATAQASGVTPNDFTTPVTYRVTAGDNSTQDYTVTVTIAAGSPNKDLTSFQFLSATNPGLTADVTAAITGTNITATLPFGTNTSALIATFATTGTSVSIGAAAQTSGVTSNSFSAPVTYTVHAQDGTTKDYSVTVIIAAASPNKDITAFSFQGLTPAVTATITGTNIAATVPFGTDVTALIATFTTTGTSVTIGAAAQTSGVTPNDFSAPVTYTVHAQNGTTQSYTVTITIAAASANKDITAFSFASPAVTATITGTDIAATVPFGTDVTALVATFTSTGASVSIGATVQLSGITANDFTAPVTYTVHAQDGTTQDYTVTVTIAAGNPNKDITAFSFQSPAVTATITGTNIAATVPFGTDVTALVATFTSTGTSVSVGAMVQLSGITANDFTNPVTYTVHAQDGTTQDYTVTVTVAAGSPNKDITAFSFQSPAVTATITGTNIAATVPFGTDVTALVATFTSTGTSVSVGAMVQLSGITANDFTNPVTYTVHAQDGTTQDYTVTVTIAAGSPNKDITAFSFQSPAVTATITGTNIAATVPFGTDVTALVATFTSTGTSVSVGAIVQLSGITANDFTAPVTYTVHAQDGTTQDYTVTVTVAQSSAKAITAFSFQSPAVTATITGTNIAATVPNGTDVTALVATFTTTGASVTVGGTAQVSGTTANDFTTPVTYTVHAMDGSTQDYTVTVTIAAGGNSDKDLTALSFADADNTALTADFSGTIIGTAVTVRVPTGTDLTALVATFTTTGASVTIGATAQASGTTANDFSAPVTYTVHAQDGSTQSYTVTVTTADYCGALAAPTGGTVTVTNDGFVPSTATYACNTGRLINPSAGEQRTCAAANTWTPAAPTCDLSFMVVKVGDGTAALGTGSAKVVVEERRISDGVVGRTIALPIAAAGAQQPLTVAGSSTTEGQLSLSADGRFVTLTGYVAAPGVTTINTSSTATNQRVVGRISANGAVDTSTRLDGYSTKSIRAATTVDGTGFWTGGAAEGTRYVTLGSTGTSVVVAAMPANLRGTFVVGGQLYAFPAGNIAAIGSGTPTTTATSTNLPITVTNASGVAMLDRNPAVAGPDTMYVSSDMGATAGVLNVKKYTFDGTAWTEVATFRPATSGTVNVISIAAIPDGSVVHLVVATSANSSVLTFDDDGTNQTPAVTSLGTAGTNLAFRGVAQSPYTP